MARLSVWNSFFMAFVTRIATGLTNSLPKMNKILILCSALSWWWSKQARFLDRGRVSTISTISTIPLSHPTLLSISMNNKSDIASNNLSDPSASICHSTKKLTKNHIGTIDISPLLSPNTDLGSTSSSHPGSNPSHYHLSGKLTYSSVDPLKKSLFIPYWYRTILSTQIYSTDFTDSSLPQQQDPLVLIQKWPFSCITQCQDPTSIQLWHLQSYTCSTKHPSLFQIQVQGSKGSSALTTIPSTLASSIKDSSSWSFFPSSKLQKTQICREISHNTRWYHLRRCRHSHLTSSFGDSTFNSKCFNHSFGVQRAGNNQRMRRAHS